MLSFRLVKSVNMRFFPQGLQQLPDSLSEAVQSLDLGETESDTDSISTPSSSPSHRNPSGNCHPIIVSFDLIWPQVKIPNQCLVSTCVILEMILYLENCNGKRGLGTGGN